MDVTGHCRGRFLQLKSGGSWGASFGGGGGGGAHGSCSNALKMSDKVTQTRMQERIHLREMEIIPNQIA